MFAALIEAMSPPHSEKYAAGLYKIIAVVKGDALQCEDRARSELHARGWSAIEVKRVAAVSVYDASNPTYISAALADADEIGFGFVVYETPLRLT